MTPHQGPIAGCPQVSPVMSPSFPPPALTIPIRRTRRASRRSPASTPSTTHHTGTAAGRERSTSVTAWGDGGHRDSATTAGTTGDPEGQHHTVAVPWGSTWGWTWYGMAEVLKEAQEWMERCWGWPSCWGHGGTWGI